MIHRRGVSEFRGKPRSAPLHLPSFVLGASPHERKRPRRGSLFGLASLARKHVAASWSRRSPIRAYRASLSACGTESRWRWKRSDTSRGTAMSGTTDTPRRSGPLPRARRPSQNHDPSSARTGCAGRGPGGGGARRPRVLARGRALPQRRGGAPQGPLAGYRGCGNGASERSRGSFGGPRALRRRLDTSPRCHGLQARSARSRGRSSLRSRR